MVPSLRKAAAILCWRVWATKQVSGAVTNTRLAVRKHRGGRQGQEYPFRLR